MRKNLLMALLCLAVACVFASSALAEKVRYIEHGWDEVGQKLTTTTKTVNCTMLTENDETLSGGWYAAKGTPTYSSALKIRGDVNLILMDGCKVKAEKGIIMYGTSSLKIYAQSEGAKMGSLEAVGTLGLAAIGGYAGLDGTITIYGGIVSASNTYNGSGGAAIGGGMHGAGTVTIYGGTVSAITNDDGAAIGGSFSGAGTVTIYGGTVSAVTNGDSAAIGGGSDGAGTVNIWGGIVNARSEGYGAAIGGGSCGTAGTVSIYGGTVNASTGNSCYGAAIGGGYDGIGKVTISGGIVDAVSSSYNDSATIGNGYIGSGGFATVTGGKVRATSNNDYTLGGKNCSISLGWENNDDFIYAKRYMGSITLTKGFKEANGEGREFEAGPVDADAINERMLVPPGAVLQDYWTGADFILPDELTAVGKNAFAGITAKTVLVPAKVGSVGNDAFANSGVMKIRFLGENTSLDESVFSDCGMLFAFAPDESQTLNRLKDFSNVVAIPLDDE